MKNPVNRRRLHLSVLEVHEESEWNDHLMSDAPTLLAAAEGGVCASSESARGRRSVPP